MDVIVTSIVPVNGVAPHIKVVLLSMLLRVKFLI